MPTLTFRLFAKPRQLDLRGPQIVTYDKIGLQKSILTYPLIIYLHGTSAKVTKSSTRDAVLVSFAMYNVQYAGMLGLLTQTMPTNKKKCLCSSKEKSLHTTILKTPDNSPLLVQEVNKI